MQGTVRLPCNDCANVTLHDILYECESEYPSDFPDGSWYVEYLRGRVLVCLGCRTLTYEEAWNFNREVDERDNLIWDGCLYPDRKVGMLKPKRFAELPQKLSVVYDETVQAYNHRLYLLSTVGLRCLMEGICEHQGVVPEKPEGKFPNIFEKIEGLKQKLPAQLVDKLHAFRFMGNLAAHNLTVPAGGDLELAISIIEDLMNFLYDLDYQASRLASRHVPRKEDQKVE